MQHYTRNTVEVSEWCSKCGKYTMHRVDAPKLGPCLVCLEGAPRIHGAIEVVQEPAKAITQGELWGEKL